MPNRKRPSTKDSIKIIMWIKRSMGPSPRKLNYYYYYYYISVRHFVVSQYSKFSKSYASADK